jgi:putative hemolysin
VLLFEGTEAGVFHRDEPRMVASVLAFDRMPVSEIMTPRERISCLSVEDTCETLWQKAMLTGHYNCTSDRDHVIGIVSLKSVCANLASGARAPVRELMKARLFVRPNESVLGLLGHFRESGAHVAVVRGADGRVKGFATLVDVLEAIVGDIPALEKRLRPRPCRGAMVAKRPAGSSVAAARG